MFVAIWEFLVRPEMLSQFDQAYGPEGAWVRLFRQGEGYLRTELVRDVSVSLRYVTLDFWKSRDAYESSREKYAVQYKEIDVQCGELTEREEQIGWFEETLTDAT